MECIHIIYWGNLWAVLWVTLSGFLHQLMKASEWPRESGEDLFQPCCHMDTKKIIFTTSYLNSFKLLIVSYSDFDLFSVFSLIELLVYCHFLSLGAVLFSHNYVFYWAKLFLMFLLQPVTANSFVIQNIESHSFPDRKRDGGTSLLRHEKHGCVERSL